MVTTPPAPVAGVDSGNEARARLTVVAPVCTVKPSHPTAYARRVARDLVQQVHRAG